PLSSMVCSFLSPALQLERSEPVVVCLRNIVEEAARLPDNLVCQSGSGVHCGVKARASRGSHVRHQSTHHGLGLRGHLLRGRPRRREYRTASPQETVLAVAGYLVWSGRLQLLPVLIVALVSAVAGDNLGYWVGRHYGRAAVDRYARWLLKPGRLMVAESFVTRYGALAVCIARFVGGVRFLAGPLAGAVGLPFRSVFVGNLVGARLFLAYGATFG